jgi:hypothetical protein
MLHALEIEEALFVKRENGLTARLSLLADFT